MEFCTTNILAIHFFNILPEDIVKHELKLKGRFQAAKTVKETQQFHQLLPVSKSKLHAYKLSHQNVIVFIHVHSIMSKCE